MVEVTAYRFYSCADVARVAGRAFRLGALAAFEISDFGVVTAFLLQVEQEGFLSLGFRWSAARASREKGRHSDDCKACSGHVYSLQVEGGAGMARMGVVSVERDC